MADRGPEAAGVDARKSILARQGCTTDHAETDMGPEATRNTLGLVGGREAQVSRGREFLTATLAENRRGLGLTDSGMVVDWGR